MSLAKYAFFRYLELLLRDHLTEDVLYTLKALYSFRDKEIEAPRDKGVYPSFHVEEVAEVGFKQRYVQCQSQLLVLARPLS